MKKSLVLAMALTLGVAGTAFAANPFSDVPANHWAYASVSKLAASGIIDGMGDGTFQGNRAITRYEAAQITAKAMAKGINSPEIKKLAAEFANELNSLGMRVSKLESKIQLNGEFRLRYNAVSDKTMSKNLDTFELRTRIHANGTINKNWKAYILLENTQKLNTNGRTGEDTIQVRRAMATGKYGNFTTQIGRIPFSDKDCMLFNPEEMDGITAAYQFDKVQVKALYGRWTNLNKVNMEDGMKDYKVDTLGLHVDYQADKLGLGAAFYNHAYKDTTRTKDKLNVWDIMASYKFAPEWKIAAQYIGANESAVGESKNGYQFRLTYGGDSYKVSEKGAYLVSANYFRVPTAASFGGGLPFEDAVLGTQEAGIKGWSVNAMYNVESNIKLYAGYVDYKGLQENAQKQKVVSTYVQFYF